MGLSGKRILVGVCGGIAAYKSALLIRLLIKQGADVKVVMTPEAKDFVGVLTFSTLSKNPVAADFFDPKTGVWNNHVALGVWADVFIIAPATANTIAKMANGLSDNILLAVYLSLRCETILAPAMDLDMWHHTATKNNIKTLNARGNKIIEPETGELASGLSGEGRMAEPEHILKYIETYFLQAHKGSFSGKKILITAGPTYEKLDPVRFIGNYSSGKMGFALAEVFAAEGAQVTVVHGPVQMDLSQYSNLTLHGVESAAEMYAACERLFDDADIFIAAAAVADFSPENTSAIKIKKENSNDGLTIRLAHTKDILASMSKRKRPDQFIAGFALETNNALAYAQKKLESKGLDLIVINSLGDKGAGFQYNTNKVTLLDKNNNQRTFELKEKREVARDIANYIHSMLHA